MKLNDFIINFRRSALELELKCPLGCAECCLIGNKQCSKGELKLIRDFLASNGVMARLQSNKSLKNKLNGSCTYYSLGCSINPVKPCVCSDNYKNCDKGKGLIVSQGHDFHALELINLNNYLIESGKLLDDLKADDFKVISSRIVSMAELLSYYLKNHELPQLSGEELLELYKSLFCNRVNSMIAFDELRIKVDSISNYYIGVPCFLWEWSNEIKNDFFCLKKSFIKPIDYSLTIEQLEDDIKITSNNRLRADLELLKKLFNEAYVDYSIMVSLADQKLLLIHNN